LTLSEQQCFVWNTASQSTKSLDMLEIVPPWLHVWSKLGLQIQCFRTNASSVKG